MCSIHLDDVTAATGQRHQCATGGDERESRANQVDALATPQLQVEMRESHRPIKWMLSPHTSYRWRGERVIEPIKCMRSPHTSYRWRGRERHRAIQVYALTTHQLQVERRESQRANQVDALTTHQLQVERRKRVIEPIKCMRSPHPSYRWRGERVIEPIKYKYKQLSSDELYLSPYTIIQSLMRREMCSLHLTHPSVHTWSSGQPTVQRPGSSRGLPIGAGIRTHNLGLPRVFQVQRSIH